MKQRTVFAAVLAISLLPLTAAPARADYDDVHYYVTYIGARFVGYTPEQAYRVAAANLCVNYSEATEPRRFDTVDALAGVDPNDAVRQQRRSRFHAFHNPAAAGEGVDQSMAWANLEEQLARLGQNERNRNPGVLIHFVQDMP